MRFASLWNPAKKLLCPRRPRGFQYVGFGRLRNPCGRVLTPVDKTLALAGLAYLSANTTYMFYPNYADRVAGNRHYLYIGGQWVLSGTMTGTMDAAGTVTGGTFAMSIPTTVDMVSFWASPAAHTKFPILSFGFNRALTATEKASFSASLSSIAALCGISLASASVTFQSSVSTKYPTITGTTYYVDPVDGNDANNGTAPGAGRAWKTVAKPNGFAFNPGDGVLFKGGNTYGQVWPHASGTEAAPIIWGAYGVSGSVQPPTFAGSGSGSFFIGGNSNLIFMGLRSRLGTNTSHIASNTTASNVNFVACVFEGGAVGSACCNLASTQAVFDRCVFMNANGISLTGTSVVTVKSSAYVAYSSNVNPFTVASGCSLAWDYCLVVSPTAISTTRVADGGHNVVTQVPLFAAFPPTPAVTPTVCFTCDDTANIDDFEAFCTGVLDPLNIKATAFVSPGEFAVGDAATLAALAANGHDIANHSMNHVDLTSTNAFVVTSSNTNPTVDVDYATTTIALSCDEVGNRVTYDWSGGKKISDLQAAVVGKGWTITLSNSTNGVAMKANCLLDSLADSAGAQACPYTCAMDSGRWLTNEIGGAKTAIEAITSVTTSTLAHPYGHNNATTLNWIEAAGYLAARFTGEFHQALESIPRFKVYGISTGTSRYTAASTEAQVRAYARSVYSFLKCHPAISVFFDHAISADLRQRHAWFINEFASLGGQFTTFEAAMTAINGSHAYGGQTWTKAYDMTGADYTPASGSALLNAGGTEAPWTRADILGAAPVFSSIGAVQK